MITLSSSDVRASLIVPSGWYVCEIKNIDVKPSAGDGSTNIIVKSVIRTNDQGSPEHDDVPVKDIYMNEKMFRVHIPMLIACGFPQAKIDELLNKKIQNFSFDERTLIGKKLKMHLKTTEWNNRKSNEATDFLPLDSKVA